MKGVINSKYYLEEFCHRNRNNVRNKSCSMDVYPYSVRLERKNSYQKEPKTAKF